MDKKIFVVGMGPGKESMMTGEAVAALSASDVIVGYEVYLNLLGEKFKDKEKLSTPMTQEIERCELCFEKAKEGKVVSMICSGDAGVYGMASLMYEVGKDNPEIEIEVVAGVTAALSGAALLGAPLSNDFCIISLSDLLTPWEVIENRLAAAADADFCVVLYNPSSIQRFDHLQKACDILLWHTHPNTVCGYVENIGREGTNTKICTLKELRDESVNMFTTVFVGNSMTEVINGKMVTKRGYEL